MIAPKITNAAKGFFYGFGSNQLNKLIISEDWKAVEAKCEHTPRSAEVWSTAYGFYDGEIDTKLLPLHLICSLHPPCEAVESVIFAYPEGLRMKESVYDRIPLHTACMNNASDDVIKLLLVYYPEGAKVADNDGRLPLHYALSNSATVEVVKTLLKAHPLAVQEADTNGWLPIHVACCRGASAEVVHMLLKEFPETALCRTKKDTTPEMFVKKLHYRNEDEVSNVLEMAIHFNRSSEKTSPQERLTYQARTA